MIEDTQLLQYLERLNRFALQLSGLHDQDAIIDSTLTAAPQLVGAESSMLWPWDADQQAPTMMVSPQMRTMSFPFSDALLTLFREACAGNAPLPITPAQYAHPWPDELIRQPLIVIPLFAPQGCLGILTVHHYPDQLFSREDLLLLSSLGNLVATALVNAQLYARERHPVNLLQTSIRQVVQATSSGDEQYDEFVQSLLQVGEGLTGVEAMCAFVELEERNEPIVTASGALISTLHADLLNLTHELARRQRKYGLPTTGILSDLLPPEWPIPAHLAAYHYAMIGIPFNGKATGIVYALHSAPFADDQLAFLRTIAEQVGVGINNKQQTVDNNRLLIAMNNLTYTVEMIASTYDPQKILTIINQAANQTFSLPIVFCGWLEESGSVRIIPETAVGLTRDEEKALRLTCNHMVVRQVLKTHNSVTSRTMQTHGRPPFQKLTDRGMKDWVCLPMIVQSEVRGIMLAADLRPRDFSVRDIAVLATYANQAALAINNSLLYEQVVKRQTEQMESLLNFSQVIASTQGQEEVHQALLHAATTEMQVPAAILSRTQPQSHMQQIVEIVGIQQPLIGVEFAQGEGIIGSTAQRKTPIDSMNLVADGRCAVLRELAREEGFASSLTVPLLEHEQVLGTLTILSREARGFTDAEQNLAQALAISAALAIRTITLVDPAVVSHHHTRDITHHALAMLTFLTEFLEASRQTASPAIEMQRARERLRVLAAVQEEIVGVHPTTVDVKGAMLRLKDLWISLGKAPHPTIRIEGARILVPNRKALALAMLIHEWVANAVALPRRGVERSLVLTFQQSYRDIWVQLDIEGNLPKEFTLYNPAIFALSNQILSGTLETHREQRRYVIRYHFTLPDLQ